MTAYQEFISNPAGLKQGKTSRLWELEIDREPDNMIDFTREFLKTKGFKFTGNQKGDAIFNQNFKLIGTVQEGNKIAIRINQM